IGDYAKTLAGFIQDNQEHISTKWFPKFHISEMLDVLGKMLKSMREAVVRGDTRLARKTTAMDEQLNNYYRDAFKVAASLIKKKPERADIFLALFAITRDLERGGDHTKNIAEELVFHIEAKVLKHRGR